VVVTTGGGTGVFDLLAGGTKGVDGGGAAVGESAGDTAGETVSAASLFVSGAVGGGAGEGGATVAAGAGSMGATALGRCNFHQPPARATASKTMAIPPSQITLLAFGFAMAETGCAVTCEEEGGGAGEASKCARTRFNSEATSIIDCQRSAGFLRRQRAMRWSNSAGTSGAMDGMGFTSSRRTAESVESPESPSKARWPVTISYSTAPNEKMSERASTFNPSACSGDM